MGIDGKHALIAGTLILLLVFAFLPDDGHRGKETAEGVVTDCSKTDNGYVFSLLGENGSRTRCFSKTPVTENTFLKVTGKPSPDGGIFFVDGIISNNSYTPVGFKAHVRRR